MATRSGGDRSGMQGREQGRPSRARPASRSARPKRRAAPLPGSESDRQTIRRLKAELARARAQIVDLQASAETDFLLGILNRRGFERALQRAVAYVRRYHVTAAVVVLDVDRLKPINDAHGHAAGDAVLKAIAAELAAQVRASDIVARLGGDEFAVLLWNLNALDAHAKAAALEDAIGRLSFSFGGRIVTTGVSAGVAMLQGQGDARSAVEAADATMYVRKAQRRHDLPRPSGSD